MSQQSGWQLAGTGPESYERHNVVAFMGTSRELVALAALRSGERVLDVACGAGVLARLAANAVGPTGKVAGADLNEGMLSIARAKAEQEGLPIEWRVCDAAERQLGPGTGAPIRAAFALSDAPVLCALVTDAGFSRVRMRITTNLLRFPSLEQYLFGYLAATPTAPQVALMDDRGRAAPLGAVANALRTYITMTDWPRPWKTMSW